MKSGIAKRISIEIRMCVGSNGTGLTVVGPAYIIKRVSKNVDKFIDEE